MSRIGKSIQSVGSKVANLPWVARIPVVAVALLALSFGKRAFGGSFGLPREAVQAIRFTPISVVAVGGVVTVVHKIAAPRLVTKQLEDVTGEPETGEIPDLAGAGNRTETGDTRWQEGDEGITDTGVAGDSETPNSSFSQDETASDVEEDATRESDLQGSTASLMSQEELDHLPEGDVTRLENRIKDELERIDLEEKMGAAVGKARQRDWEANTVLGKLKVSLLGPVDPDSEAVNEIGNDDNASQVQESGALNSQQATAFLMNQDALDGLPEDDTTFEELVQEQLEQREKNSWLEDFAAAWFGDPDSETQEETSEVVVPDQLEDPQQSTASLWTAEELENIPEEEVARRIQEELKQVRGEPREEALAIEGNDTELVQGPMRLIDPDRVNELTEEQLEQKYQEQAEKSGDQIRQEMAQAFAKAQSQDSAQMASDELLENNVEQVGETGGEIGEMTSSEGQGENTTEVATDKFLEGINLDEMTEEERKKLVEENMRRSQLNISGNTWGWW